MNRQLRVLARPIRTARRQKVDRCWHLLSSLSRKSRWRDGKQVLDAE